MLIVVVDVRVKPECVEPFRAATLENARHSLLEKGVVSFDVLQQAEEPTRFLMIEAYRSADAVEQHKQTAHYQVWRDTVAPMMSQPRERVRCTRVFPEL